MATKITRPEEGRIVGGVCQGIANAFDLDPTIVRIVTAVLILAAGSGPLIYLVLWVIIPDERSGSTRLNCRSSGRPPTLWWLLMLAAPSPPPDSTTSG